MDIQANKNDLCMETVIHSLCAICHEMSGHCLQFGLFKISLLLAVIPANPDNVKTFFSLTYTNITIPQLIHILYPLEKWFVTYFALVLTCDWLISKIDSRFCLGGLGLCAHTLSELVLKKSHCEKLGVHVFHLNDPDQDQ